MSATRSPRRSRRSRDLAGARLPTWAGLPPHPGATATRRCDSRRCGLRAAASRLAAAEAAEGGQGVGRPGRPGPPASLQPALLGDVRRRPATRSSRRPRGRRGARTSPPADPTPRPRTPGLPPAGQGGNAPAPRCATPGRRCCRLAGRHPPGAERPPSVERSGRALRVAFAGASRPSPCRRPSRRRPGSPIAGAERVQRGAQPTGVGLPARRPRWSRRHPPGDATPAPGRPGRWCPCCPPSQVHRGRALRCPGCPRPGRRSRTARPSRRRWSPSGGRHPRPRDCR